MSREKTIALALATSIALVRFAAAESTNSSAGSADGKASSTMNGDAPRGWGSSADGAPSSAPSIDNPAGSLDKTSRDGALQGSTTQRAKRKKARRKPAPSPAPKRS